MDNHLTALTLGMDVIDGAGSNGLTVSGGSNGITVTKFSWNRVPRTLRRDRPRRHGTVDLTRFYGGRLFNIEGQILKDNEVDACDLLDDLSKALALDPLPRMVQWQLSGGILEQAIYRPEGDLDYGFPYDSRSLIKWAATFFSEDPRRYDVTLNTESYNPFTDPGPSVIPGGNFSTPAKFTITGPVSEVEVVAAGEIVLALDASYLLPSSTVAVVSVADRTIKVDGTYRPDLVDATTTTWAELIPGEDNLVALTGHDMDANTQLDVAWRDARI